MVVQQPPPPHHRIHSLQRHLIAPASSRRVVVQAGPHLVEYLDCPQVPGVAQKILTLEALTFLAELTATHETAINEVVVVVV